MHLVEMIVVGHKIFFKRTARIGEFTDHIHEVHPGIVDIKCSFFRLRWVRTMVGIPLPAGCLHPVIIAYLCSQFLPKCEPVTIRLTIQHSLSNDEGAMEQKTGAGIYG